MMPLVINRSPTYLPSYHGKTHPSGNSGFTIKTLPMSRLLSLPNLQTPASRNLKPSRFHLYRRFHVLDSWGNDSKIKMIEFSSTFTGNREHTVKIIAIISIVVTVISKVCQLSSWKFWCHYWPSMTHCPPRWARPGRRWRPLDEGRDMEKLYTADTKCCPQRPVKLIN